MNFAVVMDLGPVITKKIAALLSIHQRLPLFTGIVVSFPTYRSILHVIWVQIEIAATTCSPIPFSPALSCCFAAKLDDKDANRTYLYQFPAYSMFMKRVE